MDIGCKLKQARNDRGLTQEKAAELLGVSRQTISNWENSKSYPDIVSVIKMSDVYAVSLDHLLKEENSVKQTYQAFLEESTNTVKAKRNLGKIVLIAAYFITWTAAMLVFWLTKGPVTAALDVVFRWLLLPLLLLAATVVVAKHDYWGKGKWLCPLFELFCQGCFHIFHKNINAGCCQSSLTAARLLLICPYRNRTIEICVLLTLLMNRKHTLIHLTNRITQLINILRKMAGKDDRLALSLE